MSPELALLGFAAWTLALLIATVGSYRWGRILTGRQRIGEFEAGDTSGPPWYRRAIRAHANCVETLPVFGAVVFALRTCGVVGPEIDALCAAVLFGRVGQSVVHVAFEQIDRTVAVRFLLFLLQVVCMLGLMLAIACRWR